MKKFFKQFDLNTKKGSSLFDSYVKVCFVVLLLIFANKFGEILMNTNIILGDIYEVILFLVTIGIFAGAIWHWCNKRHSKQNK